jgi:signal transduction histidine kinase
VAADAPTHQASPYAGLPIRSYLAVPVASGSGEVLGGLFFGHTQADVFDERAERLANGIAAQAAVAIENARLYDEVRRAVHTRDEFLAAAAHDLKTPLALTKGLAQLLARRVRRMNVEGGDSLMDGLQRIDASVDRMTSLIEELLDLGRLQLGRPLELELRPTDLAALARQAVADQQPNAPDHHFNVHVPAEGLVGTWDPVRLRRVLDNLLSNAVKYSPRGGEIEVTVELEPGEGPSAAMAVLRVSDQGVGIPADDLPHIFERFRRGANVGLIQGTGIGLGVAHRIVEQHGGTISAQSTEGAGSTFMVRVPLGEHL